MGGIWQMLRSHHLCLIKHIGKNLRVGVYWRCGDWIVLVWWLHCIGVVTGLYWCGDWIVLVWWLHCITYTTGMPQLNLDKKSFAIHGNQNFLNLFVTTHTDSYQPTQTHTNSVHILLLNSLRTHFNIILRLGQSMGHTFPSACLNSGL